MEKPPQVTAGPLAESLDHREISVEGKKKGRSEHILGKGRGQAVWVLTRT